MKDFEYTEYSVDLLEGIINSLATPIFIKNDRHEWILVNDAYCNMLGIPREEWLGKSDFDFFPAHQAEVFWAKDQEAFETEEINVNEEEITVPDGQVHIIKTTKKIFHDPKLGKVLCGVFTDITDLKRTQRELQTLNNALTEKVAQRTTELELINSQLKELAFRDMLTGLFNRPGLDKVFEEYLRNAASRNGHFAVIYLDVDNLKFVNDSYGHPIGDALIKEVGEIAESVINRNGIIARVGGDEFVILTRFKNREEVDTLADLIARRLQGTIVLNKRQISMSSSIGIACYPEDGRDQTTLTKNADAAMYKAKELNRGGYLYYRSEYTDYAKRKLEIESELRQALLNNDLEVHYQPIVAANENHNIVGYEALARWYSHEFGSVSPLEFIPIAEQSDMILMLGDDVLLNACRFLQMHCEAHQYVSVNVSSLQLLDPEFAHRVQLALEMTGANPRQLVLEITETTMMSLSDELYFLHSMLSSLGVRFFIDDFGTGFSNMAQLKRLRFDAIKVDREFVKDLPHSDADISLIKTIVFMAREFGIKVIFEGVEEITQEQHLKALGCDFMQGYLFGKPFPAHSKKNRLQQSAPPKLDFTPAR